MIKLVNSVIAIMLFILASNLAEANRIERRIAKLEAEHNRLLQEQNIELQVLSCAGSEISRSIDQGGLLPIELLRN